MSRLRALGRFVSRHRTAIGAVLLIWGGITLHKQGVALHHTQQHQAAQQRELRAAEASLHTTQMALEATQTRMGVSQKQSTETRITTVTQRCQFTKLVVDELVLRAPTIDAAPFERSYRGCQRQLAKVKQINAATPAPPPR